MGILKYDSHRTTQIRFADIVNINSVICDFSVLYVIEAVDQIGNCCLSCPCRAYKCKLLPCVSEHFHIMQYNLIIGIPKIYIVEYYVTFQLYIGCISVFIQLFPRPASGSCCTFYKCTVLFFDIYQSNGTFVYLRLFVKQTENSFCSGKCHNDRVELLAYLVDWHVKASVKGQEARKSS